MWLEIVCDCACESVASERESVAGERENARACVCVNVCVAGERERVRVCVCERVCVCGGRESACVRVCVRMRACGGGGRGREISASPSFTPPNAWPAGERRRKLL